MRLDELAFLSRRPETWNDLLDYCRAVCGLWGVIMLLSVPRARPVHAIVPTERLAPPRRVDFRDGLLRHGGCPGGSPGILGRIRAPPRPPSCRAHDPGAACQGRLPHERRVQLKAMERRPANR